MFTIHVYFGARSFMYESNVLPQVGDVLVRISFPPEYPVENHFVVKERTLFHENNRPNSIIVTVEPRHPELFKASNKLATEVINEPIATA